MDIREKMKLMHENFVIDWHEHAWFTNFPNDLSLNVELFEQQMVQRTRLGIDKAVFSLPVVQAKRGKPEYFQAANRVVREACQRHPDRCYGMAYVHGGYMKEALYEIEKCVNDWGFVGIKIYYDYLMDDPIQNPIIEKCIDLDVPIMVHSMRFMDPPNRMRQPFSSNGLHIANAAKRYPEAVFQMGHFTICDWHWSLKAIAPYKNVYTDMSGSAYDRPQIEYAVDLLGADRILFATDCSLTTCVGKILGARISDEDKKTILAGKAFQRYLDKANV